MARTSKSTAAPEASAPAHTPPPEATSGSTTLTGRLCADPVLRRTATGIPVTNLRVAVNTPDGEATFHDVVVWRRQAEVVARYMRKGRLVEVTGTAQSKDWTDKNGTVRQSDEIVAYRVQFLNARTTAPVDEIEPA